MNKDFNQINDCNELTQDHTLVTKNESGRDQEIRDRLSALELIQGKQPMQLTSLNRRSRDGFEDFVRKGYTNSDSNNVIMSDTIHQVLIDRINCLSPLLNACMHVKISGSEFNGIIQKVENDQKQLTKSKASRQKITTHQCVSSLLVPYATLQDPNIQVDKMIHEGNALQMANKLAKNIILGDGNNTLTGILHTGSVAKHDRALDMKALLDIFYMLPENYRSNGTWVMNSKAHRFVIEALQGGLDWKAQMQSFGHLFGRPIIISDELPDANPVIFGDLNMGYCVLESDKPYMTRDPYTHKPDVEFTTTRLVGGAVINSDAIKILNIKE